MEIDLSKYNKDAQYAIEFFWTTRASQRQKQIEGNVTDQGDRGAVTGRQQMNGFLELLTNICQDLGVQSSNIYTRNNHLPGFFRPAKDWDFVVLSPHVVWFNRSNNIA
jgi:hypothetical protein